jgi:hypothetical protein
MPDSLEKGRFLTKEEVFAAKARAIRHIRKEEGIEV